MTRLLECTYPPPSKIQAVAIMAKVARAGRGCVRACQDHKGSITFFMTGNVRWFTLCGGRVTHFNKPSATCPEHGPCSSDWHRPSSQPGETMPCNPKGPCDTTPASCFARSRPLTRDRLETFVVEAESWARRPEMHIPWSEHCICSGDKISLSVLMLQNIVLPVKIPKPNWAWLGKTLK